MEGRGTKVRKRTGNLPSLSFMILLEEDAKIKEPHFWSDFDQALIIFAIKFSDM